MFNYFYACLWHNNRRSFDPWQPLLWVHLHLKTSVSPGYTQVYSRVRFPFLHEGQRWALWVQQKRIACIENRDKVAPALNVLLHENCQKITWIGKEWGNRAFHQQLVNFRFWQEPCSFYWWPTLVIVETLPYLLIGFIGLRVCFLSHSP